MSTNVYYSRWLDICIILEIYYAVKIEKIVINL